MIRVLLSVVLPCLAAAGATAALVGKNLLLPPRGEPMLVAASTDADPLFHPAGGPALPCAAMPLGVAQTAQDAGVMQRTVKLTLPDGVERVAVVLQAIPAADPASGPTLILAVDADGRILGVSNDPEADWLNPAADDCPPAADPKAPGAV